MGNNFQCCIDRQECQDLTAKDIVDYEEEESTKLSAQPAIISLEQADTSFDSDSLSLSYSPSNATTTTTEINWDLESTQTVRISGGPPELHPVGAVAVPLLLPSKEQNPGNVPVGKKMTSKTTLSSSLWTPLKSKTTTIETAHPNQSKSVERLAYNGARVKRTKQRSMKGNDQAHTISSDQRVGGTTVSESEEDSAPGSSEGRNAINDGASVVGPGRANWPCVGIHAYYHPHYPRKGASPTSVSPSSAAISPSHNEASCFPPVEKSGYPTARTPEHPPTKKGTPTARTPEHPARKLDFSPPKHSPEAPPFAIKSTPSSATSKSGRLHTPQTTSRRPDKESPHKETVRETIPNKLAFLHQRQPWKG